MGGCLIPSKQGAGGHGKTSRAWGSLTNWPSEETCVTRARHGSHGLQAGHREAMIIDMDMAMAFKG